MNEYFFGGDSKKDIIKENHFCKNIEEEKKI